MNETIEKLKNRLDEITSALLRLSFELGIEDLGPDKNVDTAIRIVKSKIGQLDSNRKDSILHITCHDKPTQAEAAHMRKFLFNAGFKMPIMLTPPGTEIRYMSKADLKRFYEQIEKWLKKPVVETERN